MKKVYIAHPLRGAERKKNVQETTQICQKITELFPEILPVSPIHAFSFLDGGGAEGEKKALALCLETVKQCNELWLFGEWWNSSGCQSEWAIANGAGIKIIDFSPQAVEYMLGLDKMSVLLDWLHFEVYKPALKPCPFCGAAAEIKEEEPNTSGMLQCSAKCTVCPKVEWGGLWSAFGKKEAIAAWNTREGGENGRMRLGDLIAKLLEAEYLSMAHPDTEVVCRISQGGKWIAIDITDIECKEGADGTLALIGGKTNEQSNKSKAL